MGTLGDPTLADLDRRWDAVTGDLAVETQPVEQGAG